MNDHKDLFQESLVKDELENSKEFYPDILIPKKSDAGRNPKTGENIPVMAKRLPFFKAGKGLRAMVDENKNLMPK